MKNEKSLNKIIEQAFDFFTVVTLIVLLFLLIIIINF